MALIFKDIELNLASVRESDKSRLKKEVADLLYNEVLRSVAQGKSPVAGESGNFKKLSKAYSEREKQGNRTANLQLEGDLIREDLAARVLDEGDIIRIGHFNPDTSDTQGEKADGHNQHTAKAQAWALTRRNEETGDPFPKRRYIPSSSQTFRPDIMARVEKIINKYKVNDPLELAADIIEGRLSSIGKVQISRVSPTVTAVSIDDILSDEFISELLRQRLEDEGENGF
jgi:hypothetical protein